MNISEADMSALLGRPLSTYESSNYNLYLKIAKYSLDQLLCTNLCDTSDPRTFDAREGYSTLFTDIFTEIESVTIDGTVIDPSKYTKMQSDRRNGSWYNSLVFSTRFTCNQEVVVSASWGFSTIPSDLKMLLAQLFGLISAKNKQDVTIQSKQVEDFRIAFNVDADLDDDFYNKYNVTIYKYSMCYMDNVISGDVYGC